MTTRTTLALPNSLSGLKWRGFGLESAPERSSFARSWIFRPSPGSPRKRSSGWPFGGIRPPANFDASSLKSGSIEGAGIETRTRKHHEIAFGARRYRLIGEIDGSKLHRFTLRPAGRNRNGCRSNTRSRGPFPSLPERGTQADASRVDVFLARKLPELQTGMGRITTEQPVRTAGGPLNVLSDHLKTGHT